MERVIQVLDDMVRDDIIEDYVVGGATAVLYFSVPNFITEDIDVFVYLKGKPTSSIIDFSPLYDYVLSKKNASIQGEYIIVEGFPVQFLIPYDNLSKEAFEKAIPVSTPTTRFKIFDLEYSMAIMIQFGKEKYVERLRTLLKHRLFDSKKLDSLLERFNLTSKWLGLKKQLEGV